MMGFLFRWGAMGLGGFILLGSLQAMITFKPADETARPVDSAGASSLIGKPGAHFIQVSAGLDTSTRLYRTGLDKPAFVTTNTNQRYPIEGARADEWRRYLGCTVIANAELDPRAVMLQVIVKENHADKGEVRSERQLSSVLGTRGALWVVSPTFRPGSVQPDNWETNHRFTGRICLLDDLTTNESSISHNMSEFRRFAMDEYGFQIPHDALVLIDDTGFRDGGTALPHYVPVAGTNSRLLAKVTEEQEQAAATSVTGVMEKAPAALAAAVRDLSGSGAPDTIAVLDTGKSGASFNALERGMHQFGVTAGIFLFAIGFFPTWLLRVIRKRRLEKQQQALAYARKALMGGEWNKAA